MSKRVLITGMGRSGSKWLAETLRGDPDDPRVLVTHEHQAALDYSATRHLWTGDWEAARDLIRDRRPAPRISECDVYIEVAPCARYLDKLLVERHLKLQVFHLVRDGRAVVRSMMARAHYRPGRPTPAAEIPVDHLETRFQKFCWLWQHAADHLGERMWFKHERVLELEGIRSLCTTLDLPPSEIRAILDRFRPGRVVNATMNEFPIPEYSGWTHDMKGDFWKLCGRGMKRFGYREES